MEFELDYAAIERCVYKIVDEHGKSNLKDEEFFLACFNDYEPEHADESDALKTFFEAGLGFSLYNVLSMEGEKQKEWLDGALRILTASGMDEKHVTSLLNAIGTGAGMKPMVKKQPVVTPPAAPKPQEQPSTPTAHETPPREPKKIQRTPERPAQPPATPVPIDGAPTSLEDDPTPPAHPTPPQVQKKIGKKFIIGAAAAAVVLAVALAFAGAGKSKPASSVKAASSQSEKTTADGVEINATNFPDAIFRKYVSDNFDTDGDGRLNDNEALSVKK